MDLMSASVQQLEQLRPSSTSPVKDDASWREEVEERAQRGKVTFSCFVCSSVTNYVYEGGSGVRYRERDLLFIVILDLSE